MKNTQGSPVKGHHVYHNDSDLFVLAQSQMYIYYL